ncbi:hypothetical protein SELMODRAFT_406759 [Selaginella moellendorffii]|uniref:Uncharacterized protein n=1 Tax=Selaginella moellendorffii TaxID=88036 RepID=D8R2U9_SELML|nr:hypothetical protein SELMODRAFT_406759 [Selaginella moellendorffii]
MAQEEGGYDHGNPRREFKTKNSTRKNWKLAVVLIVLLGVIVVLVVGLALKPEPADIDHSWVFLEEMRPVRINLSSPTSSAAAQNSSRPFNSTPRSGNSSARIVGAITTVLCLSNPNLSGKFTYYNAASFVFSLPGGDKAAGRAAIAPGTIKPQARRNLSATVHGEFDAPRDSPLLLGVETNLTGFVHKWVLFKHHFVLSSICELQISTANTSLVDYSCGQSG